jgi:hypothetical protein
MKRWPTVPVAPRMPTFMGCVALGKWEDMVCVGRREIYTSHMILSLL